MTSLEVENNKWIIKENNKKRGKSAKGAEGRAGLWQNRWIDYSASSGASSQISWTIIIFSNLNQYKSFITKLRLCEKYVLAVIA